MTNWYSITPTGPISIGNLTSVGQNSGQVGCRWPPNGHHLAAAINLPTDCQLWGPFWGKGKELYVTLPKPVYTLDCQTSKESKIPQNLYRMSWRDNQWQVRPEHQNQEIEIIGGRYLILATYLRSFWPRGKEDYNPPLEFLPWKSLTLSHNRREDYQVPDEDGFFAEMTTMLASQWSILFKIQGDYTPPLEATLGAGGTPIVIQPHSRQWDWLGDSVPNANVALLITGALWGKNHQKISVPYPVSNLSAYAADSGIPWQSWKWVKDRHDHSKRVQVLTPGEWLTPPGAVYIGAKGIFGDRCGPFPDQYKRHVLGYGHLWLFEEEIE